MVGFVLGTGCCGSSLVHEILARHGEVGFLSNVDDRIPHLPRVGATNRAVYARVPQEWTRKGRVRFAPSEGYRALEKAVSPLVAYPGRRLSREDVSPRMVTAFRDFFAARWEAQGTPHFLHKFTGGSRVQLLHAAFPEARYIHVVRDGRAVANSFMKQSWWVRPDGVGGVWRTALPEKRLAVLRDHGDSWVLLSGLAWLQMIEDHESDRSLVPDEAWLEVRYEDVVADPEGSLTRMCDHLGIAVTDVFRRTVDGYRLESARTDGFRRELGQPAVDLLTEQLAEQLGRLEYQA